MKTVTTPVLRRFGFRNVLAHQRCPHRVHDSGLRGLYFAHAARLIIAVLFVHGVSRSMQFTSLTTLAFADIPKPSLSSATTFFSMVTQMSMGMGVAVGAVALRAAAFLTRYSGDTPHVSEFHIAFVLIAVMALLAVVDCFTLDPKAGAEVSGHRAAIYRGSNRKSLKTPSSRFI